MNIRTADVGLTLTLFIIASGGALPPSIIYFLVAIAALLAAMLWRVTPYIDSRGATLAAGLLFWALSAWISSLLGGLSSTYPADSYTAALRLSLPPIMFLYGYSFGHGRVITVLAAVAWIGAFHATWSLFQLLFGGAAIIGGVARASGALTPNVLANLLGLCLICSTMVASGVLSGGIRKKPYIVLSALIFAGMIGAGTLKNILVAVLVLTIVYIASTRHRFVVRAALIATFSVVASPFILINDRFGGRLKEASDIFGGMVIDDDGRPSSLLWRFRHWQHLISDWKDNYFWFGSGVGQSSNMAGIRAPLGQGAMAHGDWVAVLVEGGVIFGAIWSFLALAICATILRAPVSRGQKLFLWATTLYFSVIMIGGNVIYTSSFLFAYWAVIGTIIGASSRVSSSSLGFRP